MPQEIKDAKTEQESSSAQDDNRVDSSTAEQDANAGKSMAEVLQASMAAHLKDSSTTEEKDDKDKDEGEEESDSTVEHDEEETQEELDARLAKEKKEKEDGEAETEEGKEEEDTKAKDKQKKDDERLDKHPRFQEMLAKNKELEGPAKFGSDVQQYLRQNRVPKETFDQALQVCSLLANNPLKAYEVLKPIMASLSKINGDTLAPDLLQAVTDGEMTEKRAKEFQKLRSQHDIGTKQSELSAREQVQASYANAMNGWVSDKMRTDPDYKPVSKDQTPGIFEMTEALFARARNEDPKFLTPVESVALAEKCYKDAKSLFSKKMTPTPQKRKTLRPSGGGGSGRAEPKTLAEVIKQSFEKHTK